MALVLNEEQQMLKDAASSFLGERTPVSHLREIRDSGNTERFSRDVWSEMADMGWAAILVPEEFGGLDYGYTGLGIVLEETGRTLTPSPLLSTAMTGVAALNLAGSKEQCAEILPGVTTGDLLLALACDEGPQHKPASVETKAEQQGTGFSLTGSKTLVMGGQSADVFIVSADTGNGISLFLVPADAPGVTVDTYPVLDIEAAARLTFDRVDLSADRLLGELNQGEPLLNRILDVARIGSAAEMLGIAQETFERTLGYLKERKQFGVPIGSFQALQHRAAHLFGEIELSKSLVLKALHALDEDSEDCAEIASLAKAKVSQTAHLATTEGVQMHGGIGMTDDFEIGFFLKRWRILDTQYGNQYFHRDRFARCRGY